METKLYMLTETSPYMMSFVIETRKGNLIVIDGGRPEDMPLLKEIVAGRPIKAWILTHAHSDHISGFVSEMKSNGAADFDFEAVYYNFPDYDALVGRTDVPDRAYFLAELEEMLPAFREIEPRLADRAHTVRQGERISVDEVTLDVLYTGHDGLYANLMNDYSLVFKLTAPNRTVLFLGDLGPDGGDILYRESRHLLKADAVQMAHHGHMNVSMEVYAAISPEICLWCAPLWLYNEPQIPPYLADTERLTRMKRLRMYGTAVTRAWMDRLGAKTHLVSGNGTQTLLL